MCEQHEKQPTAKWWLFHNKDWKTMEMLNGNKHNIKVNIGFFFLVMMFHGHAQNDWCLMICLFIFEKKIGFGMEK